jgi:hypothetical protein
MCCLSAEHQILVAVAAAEVVAAVRVLQDHLETLNLLIQDPQGVDLTPSAAGHCEVDSCDVMEAPKIFKN